MLKHNLSVDTMDNNRNGKEIKNKNKEKLGEKNQADGQEAQREEFKRTLNGPSCFCAVCHYLELIHISGAFCFKSKSYTLTDTTSSARDTCQYFLLQSQGLNVFMEKTETLNLLSQRPTFTGTMI